MYILLSNPVGSDRRLSGREELGMSPRPSRNDYVAKTVHLTEQNFDEVLVATDAVHVEQSRRFSRSWPTPPKAA